MLQRGILNPAINSLISRVRHTNTLVIADRGFPFWPALETIDISLVDGIPRVTDVLAALRLHCGYGAAWMAEEFHAANTSETKSRFLAGLDGIPLTFEPHMEFKKRVPHAIGLIRTGDATPYANLILESA
jgi:D-ribose pyranase